VRRPSALPVTAEKDGAARDGPAGGGDEHREQGVIAPRGQQGAFASAAPLPDVSQVPPGPILQPRIDETLGKQPFPRGLGPRQAAGLEQGIDLFLVDMEITGKALRIHPLILNGAGIVVFHDLTPGLTAHLTFRSKCGGIIRK